MSGAGMVDTKTFTIWRNAFVEVLRSKRRERGQLTELLRRKNVVRLMTGDAAEFIAWLLEPRDKRGVRPLPRKFKLYQEIANDRCLFDALDEIHQRRVVAGGKLRDIQNHYKEVAKAFGVNPSRLKREDRRSRQSGRRIGFF